MATALLRSVAAGANAAAEAMKLVARASASFMVLIVKKFVK